MENALFGELHVGGLVGLVGFVGGSLGGCAGGWNPVILPLYFRYSSWHFCRPETPWGPGNTTLGRPGGTEGEGGPSAYKVVGSDYFWGPSVYM